MKQDSMDKVRALVVDDAAFMRRALVEILSANNDIDVVGVARHGKEALEAAETLDPDVITLDVDMPVMDGLTTIKHLMVRKPRPVIMVSGMADQGKVTFEALRLGAVDFFQKPSGTISLDMKDAAQELAQVVRLAARINPRGIKRVRLPARHDSKSSDRGPAEKLLVVFALEGACGSFIRMIASIEPEDGMAVAAQQAVSASVLSSYASEFNQVACWDISANQEGEIVTGQCRIAGFGHTWGLDDSGESPGLRLDGPKDSQDELLEACAAIYGSRCMAVVLGGAGNPAPRGFEALKESGGQVLALAPEAAVFGAASREVLESGIAVAVQDEAELARKINLFAKV